MLKYMKYEMKGTYRVILGILLIMILASFFIQSSLKSLITNIDIEEAFSKGSNILLILSILLIFGSAITVFVYIISQFRKELYEDRGYLTFLTPLTGTEIVGSKFLVASIWYLVLAIGFILGNVLIAFLIFGEDWSIILRSILVDISMGDIFLMFLTLCSSLASLILIYFSIAVSKVTIKNKSIGGLWFIIYLILNHLVGLVVSKAAAFFPYFLNLQNMKIERVIGYGNSAMTSDIIFEEFLGFTISGGLNINVMWIVFMTIATIVFFLLTGYLIDNKIDI